MHPLPTSSRDSQCSLATFNLCFDNSLSDVSEGCGWTGEVSQVESHLNPHPTAKSVLNGCQFQVLNFKRQLYKRNQQLHNLQKLKVIILWASVLLFAISLIIAGGLVAYHKLRGRVMTIKEIEIQTEELRKLSYDRFSYLQNQIKALQSNMTGLENKCKKMLRSIADDTNTIKELETLIKKRLSAVTVAEHDYDRRDVQNIAPSLVNVEEPHSFWSPWNLLWNLIWYSWIAIVSIVVIVCIYFGVYIYIYIFYLYSMLLL